MLMAYCKTVIIPVLWQWNYRSPALRHHCRFLSSLRVDFKYMHQVNVEEFYKMKNISIFLQDDSAYNGLKSLLMPPDCNYEDNLCPRKHPCIHAKMWWFCIEAGPVSIQRCCLTSFGFPIIKVTWFGLSYLYNGNLLSGKMIYINCLMQGCGNSSADALELPQFCTKPLISISYLKTAVTPLLNHHIYHSFALSHWYN